MRLAPKRTTRPPHLLLCHVAQLLVVAAAAAVAQAQLPAAASKCPCDREGSWAIGLFQGDSPLTMRPYRSFDASLGVLGQPEEQVPDGNPIINCSTVMPAVPTSFVADPFLWVGKHKLYVFYEFKNKLREAGEIGVAVSDDDGATWTHLGTALSEPWHLSYPFLFLYQHRIYMVPEGYQSGALRLYRAENFPTEWVFDRVMYERPLVDASIVKYKGLFWMFASDQDRTAQLCGQLEVFHSGSPLGPWVPHPQNPVLNGDPSCGARSGGRPVVHQGELYRFAQDCGGAYGKGLHAYHVDVLNATHFQQTRVELDIQQSWWNRGRLHHMDAHRLPTGEWISVIDGDKDVECTGVADFIQDTCECKMTA